MSIQRCKPILFTGEMVRAILDGRKTQTRRVIKPQPTEYWNDGVGTPKLPRCPYNAPLLWVRETWASSRAVDSRRPKDLADGGWPIWYDADQHVRYMGASQGGRGFVTRGKGRPSIHMPRWASRLTLRATNLRAQRLHDITEADAVAEGYHVGGMQPACTDAATMWFRVLWDRINGERGFGWEFNPWVWVIDFEVEEVGNG